MLPIPLLSQNIVPNGNFETLVACPTNLSQITNTSNWFAPSGGTPDYFHMCSDTAYPGFLLGYQQPHSGDAYVGIYLGSPINNYREYLEVQLQTPLIAGQTYQLSYYANAAHTKYTSDDIQAYFSSTFISTNSNNQLFSVTPQLVNTPGNYLDTLNWTLIQGNFIATGFETHLLIGNFLDKTLSTYSIQMSAPILNPSCYVYIDDISLVELISNSINNYKNIVFKIYPNPVGTTMTLQSSIKRPSTLIIYNALMQICSKYSFDDKIEINTEAFNHGTYFYTVMQENNIISKGSFIK